jgi:hypothetical protein
MEGRTHSRLRARRMSSEVVAANDLQWGGNTVRPRPCQENRHTRHFLERQHLARLGELPRSAGGMEAVMRQAGRLSSLLANICLGRRWFGIPESQPLMESVSDSEKGRSAAVLVYLRKNGSARASLLHQTKRVGGPAGRRGRYGLPVRTAHRCSRWEGPSNVHDSPTRTRLLFVYFFSNLLDEMAQSSGRTPRPTRGSPGASGTPATRSTTHPPHKCRSIVPPCVGGSC